MYGFLGGFCSAKCHLILIGGSQIALCFLKTNCLPLLGLSSSDKSVLIPSLSGTELSTQFPKPDGISAWLCPLQDRSNTMAVGLSFSFHYLWFFPGPHGKPVPQNCLLCHLCILRLFCLLFRVLVFPLKKNGKLMELLSNKPSLFTNRKSGTFVSK